MYIITLKTNVYDAWFATDDSFDRFCEYIDKQVETPTLHTYTKTFAEDGELVFQLEDVRVTDSLGIDVFFLVTKDGTETEDISDEAWNYIIDKIIPDFVEAFNKVNSKIKFPSSDDRKVSFMYLVFGGKSFYSYVYDTTNSKDFSRKYTVFTVYPKSFEVLNEEVK